MGGAGDVGVGCVGDAALEVMCDAALKVLVSAFGVLGDVLLDFGGVGGFLSRIDSEIAGDGRLLKVGYFVASCSEGEEGKEDEVAAAAADGALFLGEMLCRFAARSVFCNSSISAPLRLLFLLER